MPPVVVAIATAVSAAAADTAAALGVSSAIIEGVSTLAYSAASIGVTTGALYGIGQALQPKVPDPVARQTPLKQPMPVRSSGTGTVRTGGAYAYFGVGTVGFTTALSIDMLALLDGRSDGFVSFYLDDDLMLQQGDYWWAPGAPGKYGAGGSRPPNLVQIDYRTGLDTETSYSEIAPALPLWDANHRGDGVTSMALYCKPARREDQSADFPNGVPTPSAVIRAQLLFDPRAGGQTQGVKSSYAWTDNGWLSLLGYLTDCNGGMELNYDRFIAPAVALWQSAADEADGLISTSGMHATLLDAAAVGDGAIFLADTTGLVAGTAIQLGDGQAVTVSSLGLAGEVDLTGTLVNPHAAGELVYWDTAGQQPRWRCNALYGHDTPPGDVVKAYLATFDGWLGQRGDGVLIPRSNTLYVPTVNLSDPHIIGYQLQNYLPDEQATNQLVVSYTDPASAYNRAEAGYIQDDIDIAARGQARTQALDLPWCPSSPQAVAVARAVLARLTQKLRGTATCNLAGLAIFGERYIGLNISELGLDAVVEVTGRPTVDLQTMQVSFPWVAVGNASNSANQALCFVIDITKPSDSAPAGLTARVIDGVANALALVGATVGSGLDIAVVAFDSAVSSIVRRSASASDIGDMIAWVRALAQSPTNYLFNAEACLTAAKTFFDGTDAGITARRIIFVWQGASDHGFTGSNPGIYVTNIIAAQAIAHSMPDVLINMINTESADTTFAEYLDNTPGDGVPFAPQPDQIVAVVEQAAFGSSSTPGAGYTLPSLVPSSGSPLQPLTAPTITSVTPEYPDSGGGVAGARVAIVVDDPGATGDLTWKVQYKLHADSVWTSAGPDFTATGAPLTIVTGLIPATGSVDFQVAYVTASQVSPWSATTTVTVAAPPGGVTSTTASAGFTTTAAHNCYYVDTASAAITVTLNAAPSADEVVEIWDSTGHAGTNAISVAGNGHTIAGSSTVANFININFGHARLIFTGTQWLMQ